MSKFLANRGESYSLYPFARNLYSFAILLSGKIFGKSVFNLLANASGILFSANNTDIFSSA